MSIKIVFMGSPEFAVPSLKALADNFEVMGVVTQPDKPAGRGQVLTPPPVKVLAQQLGLSFIQPGRLREPAAMAQLQTWQPDLIVVVAFGQILRPAVLNLPLFGCVNVHASLLPRWRGAAPIQAVLLNGDSFTGVTIMRMDPGVDTGPMLNQRGVPILPDDTSGALGERLAVLGANLLVETLPGYLYGTIQPQIQDESQVTYAPMLKKEEGLLDFAQPAVLLARKVRAFNPWPGTFHTWQGQIFKVHRAHAVDGLEGVLTAGRPGQPEIYESKPAWWTAQGLLVLDEVQPAGKKTMPGEIFIRGARDWRVYR
jgi:methionyl-tRNA formyltransferase